MNARFLCGLWFRFSGVAILIFMLGIASVPAHAYVGLSLQLDVDQPTTVVGRTVILTMRLITQHPNPVRVDRLDCQLTGASIVKTSSFGVPFTMQ